MRIYREFSEKEIGTTILHRNAYEHDFNDWFRFPFGSDINPRVYCVTDFDWHHSLQHRCGVWEILPNQCPTSVSHTTWIMLTITLIIKVLRISFAREVEAAGNGEPPSGTNGLQVRREAQDFRRGDIKADALMSVGG